MLTCLQLVVFGLSLAVGAPHHGCITPNNETGSCIDVRSCASLYNLLAISGRKPEVASYLKRSQCGYENGSPRVCCPGTTAESTQQPVANPTFFKDVPKDSLTASDQLQYSHKDNSDSTAKKSYDKRAISPRCITPNNETGSCIDVRSCASLYNLLAISGRKPEVASYLKRSQCGYENGSPRVCCPETTAESIQQLTTTVPGTYSVECGKTENTDTIRILGGKNASLGDWPWMAGLGYRNATWPEPNFQCGATLISNKWLLTAAHCVRNHGSFKLHVVRLGDLDLNPDVKDGATPIDVPVDEIIVHSEYATSPAIVNDIALIRLKNTVQFSKYIRPICLLSGAKFQSDSWYSGKRPYIMGWGAVQWRGATSTRLQVASLPTKDHATCAKAYARKINSRIDERVICAGERDVDTCPGDSGGPLVFPFEDKFYVGGVVSYGIKCADPDFPGVYTKVAAFTDWISKHTGINITDSS